MTYNDILIRSPQFLKQFNKRQQAQLILAYVNGIDFKPFANPLLSSLQMAAMRLR